MMIFVLHLHLFLFIFILKTAVSGTSIILSKSRSLDDINGGHRNTRRHYVPPVAVPNVAVSHEQASSCLSLSISTGTVRFTNGPLINQAKDRTWMFGFPVAESISSFAPTLTAAAPPAKMFLVTIKDKRMKGILDNIENYELLLGNFLHKLHGHCQKPLVLDLDFVAHFLDHNLKTEMRSRLNDYNRFVKRPGVLEKVVELKGELTRQIIPVLKGLRSMSTGDYSLESSSFNELCKITLSQAALHSWSPLRNPDLRLKLQRNLHIFSHQTCWYSRNGFMPVFDDSCIKIVRRLFSRVWDFILIPALEQLYELTELEEEEDMNVGEEDLDELQSHVEEISGAFIERARNAGMGPFGKAVLFKSYSMYMTELIDKSWDPEAESTEHPWITTKFVTLYPESHIIDWIYEQDDEVPSSQGYRIFLEKIAGDEALAFLLYTNAMNEFRRFAPNINPSLIMSFELFHRDWLPNHTEQLASSLHRHMIHDLALAIEGWKVNYLLDKHFRSAYRQALKFDFLDGDTYTLCESEAEIASAYKGYVSYIFETRFHPIPLFK